MPGGRLDDADIYYHSYLLDSRMESPLRLFSCSFFILRSVSSRLLYPSSISFNDSSFFFSLSYSYAISYCFLLTLKMGKFRN